MEQIKANEVRRGNYIEYDGRYFKIDSIAEVFPTLDTTEFGIGVVDWNNIKPIPLDESILLKNCGFKIASEDDSWGGFLSPKLPNGNRIRLQKIEGKFVWNTQHTTVELEFLHELQNFFHIFKKELIINF